MKAQNMEWFLAHPDEPYTITTVTGRVRRHASLRQRLQKWYVAGAPDECWEWSGKRWKWEGHDTHVGHGVIRVADTAIGAHRVAYFLCYGFMPKVVRHSCDNPPCVNPIHLLGGTQADNLRDMSERGRHWNQKKTHCPKGHELSGDNVKYNPKLNTRQCYICHRESTKLSYLRKKEQKI